MKFVCQHQYKGCNGCLDVNLPDNAGLEIVVEKLNRISRALGFTKIVSKADFYALAATIAAEVGFEEAAKVHFSYRLLKIQIRPSILATFALANLLVKLKLQTALFTGYMILQIQ